MQRGLLPQCEYIAEDIEIFEEELRSLQEEESNAPDNQQAYYKREIRKLLRELGLRRQQLRACQEQHNPPALRPDLVAFGAYAIPNHNSKTLRVAAIVKNIGKAPAVGPFRIDLSITEIIGNSTVQRIQSFEVPPGLAIHPEPVLEQDGVLAKPIGNVTILFEYVTESMEVPLRYIDEIPSVKYEIEFIVDVNYQVNEANEQNNSYRSNRWFSSPSAIHRAKPFVIKSSPELGDVDFNSVAE